MVGAKVLFQNQTRGRRCGCGGSGQVPPGFHSLDSGAGKWAGGGPSKGSPQHMCLVTISVLCGCF